jgi:ribosomal subunit interface protein
MQIIIKSQDFSLSDRLREHIHRQVRFALSRFSDRIQRVRVNVADVNGPRGGLDKRCRIQVNVTARPELVAEFTDSNMYAAISRSASKANRLVTNSLKREQTQKRPGWRSELRGSPKETASLPYSIH